MQKYGYINDTEYQEKIKKLKNMGIDESNIFLEEDKINKVKFQELINRLNKDDSLVILEVLEAAGTTKQICDLIEICYEKRIVLFLNEFELDFTKQDAKAQGMKEMAKIIYACERKIRSRRIEMGIKEAKEEGRTVGRPRLTYDKIPDVVKELYSLHKSGSIGIREYARRCNVSHTMVAKYIKLIEAETEGIYEKNFDKNND